MRWYTGILSTHANTDRHTNTHLSKKKKNVFTRTCMHTHMHRHLHGAWKHTYTNSERQTSKINLLWHLGHSPLHAPRLVHVCTARPCKAYPTLQMISSELFTTKVWVVGVCRLLLSINGGDGHSMAENKMGKGAMSFFWSERKFTSTRVVWVQSGTDRK